MEEQWTLEKLGGHMYRHHRLWDGTPKMLDLLKKKGFIVSPDSSDDYYLDFKEDDDNFNFGASLSECVQILCDNQHFYEAFILELAMGNKDARFGKQLVETFDSIDLLFPLIRFMRIDNFMYLIAKNYNKSLGEQAKKMCRELDEDGLVTWMKGVVRPRFSGNVTLNEIRPYLIFGENLFQDINFLDAFYSNWLCVKENENAYQNWIEIKEIPMKNPGEVFNDCFLHPDDRKTKQYAGYYWFGCGPCAFHLFSMLNNRDDISIGVKSLLRDTLIDYGKGDVEFAKQLQQLYDGYKSLADWRDITFETATADVSTIESKEEPQTSKTPDEIVAQKETERKKKDAESINSIKELLTNTAGEKDFFKDGFNLDQLIDFFEKILAKESVLEAVTKTDKRMIYVYKGIVLEKFCNIIGYLISKGVISESQKEVAEALFGMEETKTAIFNWKPVDKNSREVVDRKVNIFTTLSSYISNGVNDNSKSFINPKIREWFDATLDSVRQSQ